MRKGQPHQTVHGRCGWQRSELRKTALGGRIMREECTSSAQAIIMNQCDESWYQVYPLLATGGRQPQATATAVRRSPMPAAARPACGAEQHRRVGNAGTRPQQRRGKRRDAHVARWKRGKRNAGRACREGRAMAARARETGAPERGGASG